MSPRRQKEAEPSPRRSLALWLWFLGALVLALAALAAAAFLETPAWIWALLVTGGACGLALAMAVALILRNLVGPARYLSWAAAITAVAAVAARRVLLAELNGDPLAAVTVNFPRMATASSSVVWGAVALVWGALLVSTAMEPPRRHHRRDLGRLAIGAASVTLSLYALGPLWALAGLRLNHWTLLGLVGLAGLAYAAGALYRRLFSH